WQAGRRWFPTCRTRTWSQIHLPYIDTPRGYYSAKCQLGPPDGRRSRKHFGSKAKRTALHREFRSPGHVARGSNGGSPDNHNCRYASLPPGTMPHQPYLLRAATPCPWKERHPHPGLRVPPVSSQHGRGPQPRLRSLLFPPPPTWPPYSTSLRSLSFQVATTPGNAAAADTSMFPMSLVMSTSSARAKG